MWWCIKYDDEDKQQKFKMDIIMTVNTNKVAVNDERLNGIDAEARCEGRVATEDDIRKSEEMR